MVEMAAELTAERAAAGSAKGGLGFDPTVLARMFEDQMHVYQTYWSDDPRFDSTQCTAAVPDLPSPELDDETIRRLCRFAIANRFRWPPPGRAVRKVTARGLLSMRLGGVSWAAPAPGEIVGLSVAGGGGGQWSIRCGVGRPVSLHIGVPPSGMPSILTNATTLESVLLGAISSRTAVDRGAVSLTGADDASRRFAGTILDVLAPVAGPSTRDREAVGSFVAAVR